MTTRFARPLLLLMLSLAACLGLAEWTLRAFYPTKAAFYELDERLLFRLIPGARKLFVPRPRDGREPVWVKVNAQGYRGRPLGDGHGLYRVVVYGDSCIMAEFSPLPDTYTEQLGQALGGQTALPVEVVNAGVAAYGPDQSVLRLQRDLPALRPQVVVLALFAHNDFGDLLRNKLFRLGPDDRLEANEWTLAPEVRAEFRRARWPILAKLAWLNFSTLGGRRPSDDAGDADHTPEAYRRRWEEDYKSYVLEGDNEVRNLLEDYYDADVALAPESEGAIYKVKLLTALLAEAGAAARRAGSTPVVVVIPSPVDVCDDFKVRVDRRQHPDYRPDTLSTLMARAAAEAGLPCLNLFPVFRANRPDELYFRGDDDHWNAAGQRLAAVETARFLATNKLLNAKTGP